MKTRHPNFRSRIGKQPANNREKKSIALLTMSDERFSSDDDKSDNDNSISPNSAYSVTENDTNNDANKNNMNENKLNDDANNIDFTKNDVPIFAEKNAILHQESPVSEARNNTRHRHTRNNNDKNNSSSSDNELQNFVDSTGNNCARNTVRPRSIFMRNNQKVVSGRVHHRIRSSNNDIQPKDLIKFDWDSSSSSELSPITSPNIIFAQVLSGKMKNEEQDNISDNTTSSDSNTNISHEKKKYPIPHPTPKNNQVNIVVKEKQKKKIIIEFSDDSFTATDSSNIINTLTTDPLATTNAEIDETTTAQTSCLQDESFELDSGSPMKFFTQKYISENDLPNRFTLDSLENDQQDDQQNDQQNDLQDDQQNDQQDDQQNGQQDDQQNGQQDDQQNDQQDDQDVQQQDNNQDFDQNNEFKNLSENENGNHNDEYEYEYYYSDEDGDEVNAENIRNSEIENYGIPNQFIHVNANEENVDKNIKINQDGDFTSPYDSITSEANNESQNKLTTEYSYEYIATSNEEISSDKTASTDMCLVHSRSNSYTLRRRRSSFEDSDYYYYYDDEEEDGYEAKISLKRPKHFKSCDFRIDTYSEPTNSYDDNQSILIPSLNPHNHYYTIKETNKDHIKTIKNKEISNEEVFLSSSDKDEGDILNNNILPEDEEENDEGTILDENDDEEFEERSEFLKPPVPVTHFTNVDNFPKHDFFFNDAMIQMCHSDTSPRIIKFRGDWYKTVDLIDESNKTPFIKTSLNTKELRLMQYFTISRSFALKNSNIYEKIRSNNGDDSVKLIIELSDDFNIIPTSRHIHQDSLPDQEMIQKINFHHSYAEIFNPLDYTILQLPSILPLPSLPDIEYQISEKPESSRKEYIFELSKSFITGDLLPFTDIENLPIFTENVKMKKKTVRASISAGKVLTVGNNQYHISTITTKLNEKKPKFQIRKAGKKVAVLKTKNFKTWLSLINNFDENRKLLDLYLYKLASYSPSYSLPDVIYSAITSPSLDLAISLVNCNLFSFDLCKYVFQIFQRKSKLDFLFRSLILGEFSITPFGHLFTRKDRFSMTTIKLFVSVSQQWLYELALNIVIHNAKDPHELIKIIIHSFTYIPNESLFIIRIITLISLLDPSNSRHSIHPLHPLFNFLVTCLNPFFQKFYNGFTLERSRISVLLTYPVNEKSSKAVLLLAPFLKQIIKKNFTFDRPEIDENEVNKLYSFMTKNSKMIIQKLQKPRKVEDCVIFYTYYQNICYLMRNYLS